MPPTLYQYPEYPLAFEHLLQSICFWLEQEDGGDVDGVVVAGYSGEPGVALVVQNNDT